MNVHWLAPYWLWLLLLPPMAIALYYFYSKRLLSQIVDLHLLPVMRLDHWNWRQLPWRWWLLWVGLVVAMARPVWLSAEQQAVHQPLQWVALVDVSASMGIDDLKPNRLQQVKWTLERLIKQSQPQDQVGLHVFTARAHALISMTKDQSLLLSTLNLLAPDMLPLQGSLLIDSLEQVSKVLPADVAIVVFTDGGELAERQALALPQPVLLVGVGTRQGRLASDASMAANQPTLGVNVEAVKAMSKSAQWEYCSLHEDKVETIEQWLSGQRQQRPLQNEGQWLSQATPLQSWVLLLTLLIWFSFAQRKATHRLQSFFVYILMACSLATASQPTAVWAQTIDTSPYQAWEAGKMALQDKRYADADQQLLSAFRAAKDSQMQAGILLTLGQSLSAQSQWYAAGQAFRGALAHDAQLTEAKILLSAVLKRIPRPIDKSSQADKAGDRFEGVVSDWDEATLDWDNPILPQAPAPVSMKLNAVQSPSILPNQTPVSSSLMQVEQARQDWILFGKMLDKQQDQRQFYRRLFSLEAGFGAVQDQPQAVDGVLPW